MKRAYLWMLAAILLCGQMTLTSCQGLIDSVLDNNIDNPNQNNQEDDKSEIGDSIDIDVKPLLENYKTAFITAFGVPAANHKWGFTPTTDAVRIMAEDLVVESTKDFDFNDVVFDVYMTSTGADITIQAVGSTLPISIGGKEVHELFGVPTSTLVNTSGQSDSYLSPVTFSIDGDFDNNPINIDVKVYRNGNWYELTAVEGNPPCKIAVDVSCDWCDEREPISDKYSNFISWVSGSSSVINPQNSQTSESLLFPDEDAIKSAFADIYADVAMFECYQQLIEAIRMKKIDGAMYDINLNDASDSTLLVAWIRGYQAIRKTNVVINEMKNSNVPYNHAAYSAEAIALRSFVAYNMTMLWGSIPYVTEDSDLMGWIIPSSTEDIVNNIIEILDEEKENLLASYEESEATMHLLKPAVLTLMAEINLYLGKNEESKTILELLSEWNDKDVFILNIPSSEEMSIPEAYKDLNSGSKQVIYGKEYVDLLSEEANRNIDGLGASWKAISSGYGIWNALKRLDEIDDYKGLFYNDILLPIPIQEILFNPTQTQNPGY